MRSASIPAFLGIILIVGVQALSDPPDIPELRYLDEKVDPCDDFYKFSCGNFKNVHPAPDGSQLWDHFAILQKEIHEISKEILDSPRSVNDPVALQKAKAFYTGCLNVAAMEGLNNGYKANLEFLNKLNKWPAITIDYDDTETKLSWNDLADLSAEYGLTFLFSFSIVPAMRSNSSHVIFIQRDAMANPTPSNIKPDPLDEVDYLNMDSAVRVLPYFKFLTKIALYLRDRTTYYTPDDHVLNEIDETIQYMRTVSQNGVADSETLPMLAPETTVEKLQLWTDEVFGSNFINWIDYLNRVVRDQDVVVTNTTLIMQTRTKIIYGLLKLYQLSSTRQLKNYVIARLLTHMAPDSERFMRNEWDEFSKDNQYPIYSREDYCIRQTLGSSGNIDFSLAVTHVYQDIYFDKDPKFQKASDMIDDIRNTFLSVLKNSEWMDEETFVRMSKKALKMIVLLGYEEGIVEIASELDRYYEDMKVCTWDHFGNAQRLRSFQLAQKLYLIGEKKRRDAWTRSPLEVNAFYNRGYNRIFLPVSILNNVFFSGKYNVLDYARIGSIIGHEITHGFDKSGMSYDSEGVLTMPWTNNTDEAYTAKAKCFDEQYSKYFIEEIQQYVNGTSTLNENLADNGGLRIAYKAFLKLKERKAVDPMNGGKYTPEQLFFIGFATMWCSEESKLYLESTNPTAKYPPNRYRVIGSVSNMPEFADAFKCPAGTKMNPSDKCRLW